MTTNSAVSSADDAALDVSARLASGLAHELGGLLFALRLRLESLALSTPGASPDVAALEGGFREIQGVIDAVRLLGTRAGTGRLVRERAVTAGVWLARLTRLSRYLVPRGVEIGRSETGATAVELGRIDLRRLTEAVLFAVAHVSATPGVRSVSIEVASEARDRRLVIRLRAEPANPATPVARGSFLSRARRLIKPIGARIRSRGPADAPWVEVVVDLGGGEE